MSSVTEIIQVLPSLTNKELGEVERALIQTYRERKIGIVFDDAYGVLTEEDMVANAAEMFAQMDRAEAKQKT